MNQGTGPPLERTRFRGYCALDVRARNNFFDSYATTELPWEIENTRSAGGCAPPLRDSSARRSTSEIQPTSNPHNIERTRFLDRAAHRLGKACLVVRVYPRVLPRSFSVRYRENLSARFKDRSWPT